jgi:hypothetical protein
MTRNVQHIGLALGAEQLTAVLTGTATRVSIPCVLAVDADNVERLARALEDVRAQLSAASGQVLRNAVLDIALLPPLSDARLIVLPPLRQAEAEAVIRRDAARHFVGGNLVRTIAVQLPRSENGAPVLASAAASVLIEQVREAAALVGWRVRRIVPAVAAWLTALEKSRAAERNPCLCMAQIDDSLTVLRLDDTQMQLRRLPLHASDELLRVIGNGPGRAFLWTAPENRADYERSLTAAGWQIEAAAGTGNAAVVAAQHAGKSKLELIPQSLEVERAQKQRRLAVRLAAVAALLVIAAAVTELWGVQHELMVLREQRARIHKQVIPLLAARDSINALEQRLAQFRTVQASAPRWTSALFDLSMLLPADTYLRSFHASGDTLVIEATGARAGDAIQALRGAPTFRDVRLRGQVERELEDGSTTTERFSLQARLARADTLPAAPPPRARRAAAGRS